MSDPGPLKLPDGPIDSKAGFQAMYSQKAPWDIGRPQKSFMDRARLVGGSILDAGCGTGEIALYFAERGHRVMGIDFLPEAIDRAKAKAAQRDLAATFTVMDARELKSLGPSFDTALDCGLFHVFTDEDRKKYAAGLAAVLKPGGRLLLTCFSDQEPGTTGPRRVSERELRSAFADGWNIESIEPAQIEVIPEYAEMFTKGGPKAWFLVAKRS